MRLLIDTNILIPLEPDASLVAPDTVAAAILAAAAAGAGAQLILHPAVVDDIARDRNADRRARLMILATKYGKLLSAPEPTLSLASVIGSPAPHTNAWVDNQLLAAVAADAVDFLITQDQGLHSKARRIGLADRTLTIADAVTMLGALFDTTPIPPPAVEHIRAADLEGRDPILDSLRRDYAPDFDEWLRKCKREGRQGWGIRAENQSMAALVLMKREQHEYGLRGRLLKLSTFKVSELHRGRKFGELLLKAVFGFASENHYTHIYVTVFERHLELRELLADFGFYLIPVRTTLNEVVLAKRLVPQPGDDSLDPLEYHVLLGPPATKAVRGHVYLVPIQPHYHRMLFPDFEQQLTLRLDADRPFANALRKAYLSHAGIRRVSPGDVLLFYRSQDRRALTAVGVVEATLVSTDPDELARFVAKRTVYRYDEIQAMAKRPVLALRFRQDRILKEGPTIETLVHHKVVERAPQTIGVVRDEGYEWVANLLAA